MTVLLTAAQMRAIEQEAIDSGAVTGLELMERAGQGVVEAIFEEWPRFRDTPHRAIVICGPGNNGGDGFVVARLLKTQGWDVEVFLYGACEKLPPDAKTNQRRWSELGPIKNVMAPPEDIDALRSGTTDGLLIDALFGTGLTRPLASDLSQKLHWFQNVAPLSGYKSVAIDVPSGLCSDSGRWLQKGAEAGMSCRVDLTVTFHRPRLGHVLGEGAHSISSLRCWDIGLDVIASDRYPSSEGLPTDACADEKASHRFDERESYRETCVQVVRPSNQVDKAQRTAHAHKFDHGHALVLTGGFGKTGAARLAAQAALRVGAGLVSLGVPGAAQMEVACQITSEMMTRVDGADGLVDVLSDARINALCLGPGLGLDRARALVPIALCAMGADPHPSHRAVVLDADALTTYGEEPASLFSMLHDRCVLTPHGGEFARLFPDLAKKLSADAVKGPAYSKVDATREAAARAGCVVLFKGADTVIADPDGVCAVHGAVRARSAPWLATAGAGDVLAGMICGLMARGLAPFEAAQSATWLHVEAARSFGPGLTSEDLPNMIPHVLKTREHGC